MAIKQQGTGLDFLKLGIIKDALINPLTTAQITTLAGTLSASHKGLVVTNTETGFLLVWTGAVFGPAAATSQSGLTPKGNIAFNGTEPSTPAVGDLYVFTNAGSNTWEGTNVVQAGDWAWWDGTVWNFVQGNTVQATTAVSGIVALATQAEVNTGTEAAKAVTPETLKAYVGSQLKLAKTYFNSSITTVADTPFTINHALALQHRDAFTISFKVGNSEVDVDVDSTDTNNCTITTSTAMTGTVMITGY